MTAKKVARFIGKGIITLAIMLAPAVLEWIVNGLCNGF